MTKNLENIIRAAEARTAEIEQARREHADLAQTKINEARAKVEELAAVPAAIEAKAAAGEDYDAGAFSAANDALRLAQVALKGAEARAPKAKVAQAAQNLAGVEAVRPLFEGLVNDVPVIVTNAPSSTWIGDVTDADAPAIVLAQVSETENAPDGLLTAREIEATFVTPSWAAGVPFLSADEVKRRAQEAGIGVNVMGYGDYRHDRMGVELTAAFEPVPVIAYASDSSVRHEFIIRLRNACRVTDLSQIRSQVEGELTFRGLGKGQVVRNGIYEENTEGVVGNFTVHVSPVTARETVIDGERTARVEFSFETNFGGTASQAAANKFLMHNAAKETVADLVGAVVQGMGRVTNATYATAEGPNLHGLVAIEFVSKVA